MAKNKDPHAELVALLGKEALSRNPNAEMFKEALVEIKATKREEKKHIVKAKVEEALKLLTERDKIRREMESKLAKIDKGLGKVIGSIRRMAAGDSEEPAAAPEEEPAVEDEAPPEGDQEN